MGGTKHPSFRGDIEGLRAIAVVWVVLFHVSHVWFPGGFAGVDVFFVISGYLITTKLFAEVSETGTIRVARFYAGRARRLLPAATLVLLATAAVGGWLVRRGNRANLGIDVMASATYVSNWVFAERSVDYLANSPGAMPSPLQHFWSLSVEEQFYLVWPIVLVAAVWLARRRDWDVRRVCLGLLATIAAVSFVGAVWIVARDPSSGYFATTARLWELSVGGLVALAAPWWRNLPRWAAGPLAGAGLVAIGVTAALMSPARDWPGAPALVPVLGAAAVIVAGSAHADTVAARVLSMPPLQWLGELSYGWYLWHWPALVLAAAAFPGQRWWAVPVALAGSLALAWASKRLIEDPIRHRRARSVPVSTTLAASAAVVTVSAIVGALVFASAPTLAPAPKPQFRQAAGPVDVDRLWGPMAYLDVARLASDGLTVRPDPRSAWTPRGPLAVDPSLVDQDVPAIYRDGCQVPQAGRVPRSTCSYGDATSDTHVVLLGDSKAAQWFPALEAVSIREGWRLEVHVKSSCSLDPEVLLRGEPYTECRDWSAALLDRLERERPRLVVYSQTRGIPAAQAARLVAPLERLRRAGSEVILVDDSLTNAVPGYDDSARCLEEHPQDYLACTYPREAGEATGVLTSVASSLKAPLLTPMDWVCPTAVMSCPSVVGRVPIYRQGNHVTATYAAWLSPWFHQELRRLGIAQAPPMPPG